MVAIGFLPFSCIAVAAAPLVVDSLRWRGWITTVFCLYVVPPIGARLCRLVWRSPEGQVDIDSRGFLAWWMESQWQTIFNRLPLLEEGLRLVPGLYSCWLRLWGAEVGSLVYWSPGLRVADRRLIDVGSRVVFGAGVRVFGHMMIRDSGGKTTLLVAPVRVGTGAVVGGYSLLAPGVEIAAGELTPPIRGLGPFTEWRGGRRHFAGRELS
jgi:hypothetical protein